jgi:Zn-dependent protease
MFITLIEVFDIIVMTLFIGFLFSGNFGRFVERDYIKDPIEYYNKPARKWITPEMKMAIIVAGPALILHEMAHKFVAMGFGADATFHAFYFDNFTLALAVIAIIAKLANFGFFFIVPGFVAISGSMLPWQGALIAFAGPCLNLILWVGAWAYLKYGKPKKEHMAILVFTKQINMFLFFFNMIPIPPFDGGSVLMGILHSFGV